MFCFEDTFISVGAFGGYKLRNLLVLVASFPPLCFPIFNLKKEPKL